MTIVERLANLLTCNLPPEQRSIIEDAKETIERLYRHWRAAIDEGTKFRAENERLRAELRAIWNYKINPSDDANGPAPDAGGC